MVITIDQPALLKLLQLTSPALPVGAFSYSEGLETLVEQGYLADGAALHSWLVQELRYGSVQLDVAIAARAHQNHQAPDQLRHWNQWLTASRDTAELRQQSWQMGRALVRLGQNLYPELQPTFAACGTPCNFAVAFGIIAAHWQIDADTMALGYLQSWAANLIGAAVKLVPLGQTEGQSCLLQLIPELTTAAERIVALGDDQLYVSGWGGAIASMHHETLYTRLFRS
ncbi:urease accessory protein UreF [Leptolyngbya cf. ectocarpi LEGE 11479]|uniref:Urease accessory protein UreF n=1 Tax=Leptolyngbya cf. ectocarpi LEGE 11479 TaxID=1828722 RepID=A0A928WYM5_LEPEC|nr:urease accessory protein UreF [Leptolyngbya ectocarpi]MBE9065722.1 urease accessory protein UreF [Leptolyngbya cf. ectocarpi LEGE 11479]